MGDLWLALVEEMPKDMKKYFQSDKFQAVVDQAVVEEANELDEPGQFNAEESLIKIFSAAYLAKAKKLDEAAEVKQKEAAKGEATEKVKAASEELKEEVKEAAKEEVKEEEKEARVLSSWEIHTEVSRSSSESGS